jgi:hypothetical protein
MVIANPISICDGRDAAHITNNTFADITMFVLLVQFPVIELFLTLNPNNNLIRLKIITTFVRTQTVAL